MVILKEKKISFFHLIYTEYKAEEKGNSKQDASRHCALNILHKLYKDNLIGSFDSEALSKRQLMKMVCFTCNDYKCFSNLFFLNFIIL